MQKQLVQLVDDTDGSDATETVNFSLDGTAYEIDLSAPNAGNLRESVAEYVDHARRMPTRFRSASNRPPRERNRNTSDTATVRKWLIDHGYQLNERGRIPGDLQEAFNTGTPNEGFFPPVMPAPEAPEAVVIADAPRVAARAPRRRTPEGTLEVPFQPAKEAATDTPKAAKRPARARKPKATKPAPAAE